ncbi:MAG: prepilin-type N-terminal cleavage/methylation domain-containing protein [Nitrospirae bacterium]|nr:prepilin-type N-terminal cleavage/methylation domain-containing protein [Nitrospirota bacterium]
MIVQNKHGITLVELMVVVAIIAILAMLAIPEFLSLMSSETKVKAAAKQLMDDLKLAQNEAAAQGAGSIVNGVLRRRKVFVVFNTATNAYQIFRYEDTDGNNVRIAAEATNPAGWAAAKILPNRVTFSRTYQDNNRNTATVNKGACGNGVVPAGFVDLGNQTPPNTPPCNNMPCLALNSMGFPIDGTAGGGSFYLSNGKDAFAVAINSAGLIRMCQWDKGATQWVDSH